MGKSLIFIGIAIAIVGGIIWGLNALGVPLGRLPGDIHVQKEKTSFYFPIITCIIVSIALTVLFNVFSWLFRR